MFGIFVVDRKRREGEEEEQETPHKEEKDIKSYCFIC